MEITLILFILVAVGSLLCEYVDASIGMGYGTTLTPLLLMIGFLPLDVVPAVLMGQLVGGVIGGLFHHVMGNVKLDFRQEKDTTRPLGILSYRPRSLDSQVILLLMLCGIIGALVAVFFAISIPTVVLQSYIGALVLAIGIVILVRRNHDIKLSWKGLIGVGLISSFNKGVSGGGYGPLVTGGQLVSGRDVRSSVGSTTIAETAVCTVGFISYLLIKGDIYWTLAAATSIGSILAGPLAALTVKKVSSTPLKMAIGIATCALGIITLLKTFIL